MQIDVPSDQVWPTRLLIKAARMLADLNQVELAESSGVSRKTIVAIENDANATIDYRRVSAIHRLRDALEQKHRIEFLRPTARSGPGVRLRIPTAAC